MTLGSAVVKRSLLLFVITLVNGVFAFGQCEKKVTFTCNQAREIGGDSARKVINVDAVISIVNGTITLSSKINGEIKTVSGDILEVLVCNWTDYLQNGRAQYKAMIKKNDNYKQASTVTIESKGGYSKITFTNSQDSSSQLQFDVVKYSFD